MQQQFCGLGSAIWDQPLFLAMNRQTVFRSEGDRIEDFFILKFINFRRTKMTRHEVYPDYHESYEYHGNTAIEITRKQGRMTLKQDWIFFDSVEEAQDFFYDN